MANLMRSSEGGILFGVCAGVAEYYKWNVRWVRLLWFILAFVGLGAPVVFYLILALAMPAQKKKSYSERMNERLGRN